MPQDRKLFIDVYVVGQEYPAAPLDPHNGWGAFGAKAIYIQTGSTPQMPCLVDWNTGNIDLTNLPMAPGYTNNVDITFTLKPFMFNKLGQHCAAQWATPIDKAITITPNDGEMTASYTNNMTLFLDDSDNDADQYTYKLGFMMPGYGNYFVSLDPHIVNRGVKP